MDSMTEDYKHLIEKTIHRAIMKTWHTAKRKEENARATSIVAAHDVFNLLQGLGIADLRGATV